MRVAARRCAPASAVKVDVPSFLDSLLLRFLIYTETHHATTHMCSYHSRADPASIELDEAADGAADDAGDPDVGPRTPAPHAAAATTAIH